jgi:hypothetical protein
MEHYRLFLAHLAKNNVSFCHHLSVNFSFGKVVSEEKIFLEINQSKTRMACGGHVC